MYKTTRMILFLALLVLLSGNIVSAQHTPPPPLEPCDYAGLADRLENLPSQLRAAQRPNIVLLSWMIFIGTFRAECGGYAFHSDDYGLSAVTEPIRFRDGIYRVNFSANAWATLRVTSLLPGCPASYMFVPGDGSVTVRSEVWVLEDCIMMLTFDATDRWLLRLDMILDATGLGEG